MRTEWAGRVCCLVCGAIGFATFAPTIRHHFVYDDTWIVKDNWIVKSPDTWYRFLLTSYWPPRSPDERRKPGGDTLYRPMTIETFRLEFLIHGGTAFGYHLGNVLLHGLISALTCAIAWRLWSKPAAGFVAGVLFATHPLHADAVAPIVGRSELLAAFFTLWLVIRHLRAGPLAGSALIRFHIGSALLFAAAVFSKEHALFIWPLIVVIDLRKGLSTQALPMPYRQQWRKWASYLGTRCHIGFAYAATAYFLLRFSIFGQFFRKPPEDQPFWANPLAGAGWVEHLLSPFRLLTLTGRLLIDPSALTPLWGPNGLIPPHSVREIDVWCGMILAIALIVAAFQAFRRGKPAAIGLIGFALLMLVPLHVISMASWYFAERWLYLPSAFLIVALAGITRRFRFATTAAAICIALFLMPYTWSYTAAWRDDESLNTAVLRRQPDSFQAAKNLGVVLIEKKRYAESLLIARNGAERFPDAWEFHDILSRAYAGMGNAQEARREADIRDRKFWDEMQKRY